MDKNIYDEIKKEILVFYNTYIEKQISTYEKQRKKNLIKDYVPSLPFFFSTFILIGFLFKPLIIIGIFLFFLSILLTLFIKFKEEYCYEKKSDTSIAEIRRTINKTLINTFFKNSIWVPGNSKNSQQEYDKEIKEFNSLPIVNKAILLYTEDHISGLFKDKRIKLHEANTKVTQNLLLLFIFIFPIVLLCLCFGEFLIKNPIYLIGIISTIVMFICYHEFFSFKGVFIEFELDKNLKAETIFVEESIKAKFISFNKSLFKRVILESIKFEDKYNVYSQDQIEARRIFTPIFIEKIQNIKLAFKANYIRGMFSQNKFKLAINTQKDIICLSNNYKKLDKKLIIEYYKNMKSILELAEYLEIK